MNMYSTVLAIGTAVVEQRKKKTPGSVNNFTRIMGRQAASAV